MKTLLGVVATAIVLSSTAHLIAQGIDPHRGCGDSAGTPIARHQGKTSFALPEGAKVFYLNISDSAGNTVSTNVVTMDDCAGGESSSARRIHFDSTVWIAPRVTTDVPDSLKLPDMEAFYYAGIDYRGEKTKVFAYRGFPANASRHNKVPGVVLVHGALGTAFPQWVKIWNERGFGAIAMDLEGREPPFTRHATAGPWNTLFADTTEELENQWLYHAVADVYLAYSLLVADERVDSKRVGITGISWGGIVASLAIGNADCFSFAIPVYGCGYLQESKGLYRNLYRTTVTKQWDASHWLRTVTTPTLWINGDADRIFSIDATTKSARATPNSQLTIIPGLQHNYVDGWNPREIYTFANSLVRGGRRLVKIVKQPTANDLTIEVDTSGSYGVKSIVLISSRDTLPYDADSNPTTKWIQTPLEPALFPR